MPGNTLTLSADDGEQAGEENDRTAPRHLFPFHLLPSHLEATSTRPSSSSSSRLLVFSLAARVRAARPLHTEPTKRKKKFTLVLLYTLLLFLSRGRARPFFSRAIPRSFARSTSGLLRVPDHSMVFPSYRSPLARRLTSRKILRSALISLLPRPLFARETGSLFLFCTLRAPSLDLAGSLRESLFTISEKCLA